MRLLRFTLIFLLALPFVPHFADLHPVKAAAPNANNILVSTMDTVYEYTSNGTQISATSVPYPGGRPVTESARDLVYVNGSIGVYNGTFNPQLSYLNTASGTWSHYTFPEWSTINNVSYGGLARFHTATFATDMNTFGGTAKGIIRFDFQNSGLVTQRFADTIDFADLNIGLDGFLYALESNGRTIDVYNPSSLTFQRTVTVTFGHDLRGIAVNRTGTIFGADWDGMIYRFNPSGQQETALPTGVLNLCDIDISPNGQIAVGSRGGQVFFTDQNLAALNQFSVGSNAAFVTFAAEESALYGFVKTANNQPIPNATIGVSKNPGPLLGTVQTNQEGYYYIPMPLGTPYSIVASQSGYAFLPQTVFSTGRSLPYYDRQDFTGTVDLTLPVISQFYPVASTSGKTITIYGSGFVAGNTFVYFGGSAQIPAPNVTFVSSEAIQVEVPTTTGNLNGYITVRAQSPSTPPSTSLSLAMNAVNPGDPSATFPEFVLWGDTTGDGSFGTNDLTLARAFGLSQAVPTARQQLAIDVVPLNANGSRGNGQYTATDFSFLRAVSMGQTQF